ncbi:MAG: thiamine diphosphokinase [Acidobacteriota bacterium]|nr:thiamine diphosphokinase [Acidobacteriota bacterium]
MNAAGERPRIRLAGPGRRAPLRGAVLVLNGASRAQVSRAVVLARSLAETCLLVAVDGGLRACRSGGRAPDLFVGDADSSGRRPKRLPAVIHPADKDFSDLSAALSEVGRRGIDVVIIAGLVGGRLDHEWANLFEIGAHARHFAGILAPTRRGTVVVTARGCRVATVPGGVVSLFALGGGATVSLRGTRWKLRNERIRPGSRGLSNETGKTLSLTVHTGVVAVVFP